MNELNETNETGNQVIKNLPFDDYLKIPAVSNSLLKKVNQSPAHSQIPTLQTPDMLKGSLIDTAIIEPESFEQQYIVSPTTDKRKTEYKDFIQQLEESGNHQTVISQDDYDLAINCAKQVQANPDLSAMLKRSIKQVSMVWQDTEFQELCKGRPDWIDEQDWIDVSNENGRMWDLKSARSCYPPFFTKEIYERCYHMQAAWYLDGYNACRPDQPPIQQFSILAIEKMRPYGYRIFNLSPDLIAAGRSLYLANFNRLMSCRIHDEWPSYDTTPIEVERPKWM